MIGEKILLVDDEQEVLNTLKRLHRNSFHIDTALGSDEGLEAVSSKGPYAVIVSDQEMPGIKGIDFLSKVKEISPDTVRIMLTGNATMDTAIEAVNEGNIFRFLTKPCPPDLFAKTIISGIEQYRLINAERELLEKTLSRSIKVLIDILSMVNPVAFSRAARLRKYVRHSARKLNLKHSWKYELAAMLSQLGCVTIPQDIIEKSYAGQKLSKEEQEMFDSHPSVARELIERVPRLEPIAIMIENQNKKISEFNSTLAPSKRDEVDIGAQLLRAAIDLDRLVVHGDSYIKAVKKLLDRSKESDPLIISTFQDMEAVRSGKITGLIKVNNLTSGMILGENIYTTSELLVAPKGMEITYPLLERLRNFRQNKLIPDEVRVYYDKYKSTESSSA
ncbi:hypothetical protein MNBD_NITROSPINAE02-427 [hydrothermal vent metagenome]|uniref:Response regulatory domain-containing protein n=1 Tax=hydrothermal vent metagenome TaxID=652676 RepID=A0A3B1CPM7_9ZZZZ